MLSQPLLILFTSVCNNISTSTFIFYFLISLFVCRFFLLSLILIWRNKTYLCAYVNNVSCVNNMSYAAFLIHVGTWQLLRQILTYIEKKQYHIGKKFPTLFLYGLQILYFNPMIFRLEHLSLVENTVKKKTLWPIFFLWMKFNCLKATEPL